MLSLTFKNSAKNFKCTINLRCDFPPNVNLSFTCVIYEVWRFLGPRGPLTEPMSVRPSVARKVFIINRYLGIGRSNEKISKNEVHFFLRILLLGGPSPPTKMYMKA